MRLYARALPARSRAPHPGEAPAVLHHATPPGGLWAASRTDFAPAISKARSDEAISGAPGITLYTTDGHLRPLEEIESDIIRLAIGHYRGRMTEVAKRLGIGRSTLYRRLGELGIDTAA